jgi:hypothetical protein
MICKYSFFDQQCRCFIRSRLDRSRLQPFRLIPGGHITFAIARVYTFESVRSSRITRVPSRVQTSLASIRAGWFSTALVCSPVAPEFHPPPRQTSGQRTEPQAARLACPKTPTRPAPPPLRSPHPSLLSARKVSTLRRIDRRDQCAAEVLRCAAPLIAASVAAGFSLPPCGKL